MPSSDYTILHLEKSLITQQVSGDDSKLHNGRPIKNGFIGAMMF